MKNRKGIVLAGGSGTRLHPLTIAVSKQLMPVYDKPMIYYPVSILMLADIREILIISTPHDLPLFQKLLGDGSQFGVQFTYAAQPSPDGLPQAFTIAADCGFMSGNEPAALILGDNLFYGQDLKEALLKTSARDSGATIFGYRVANPSDYGVVEFDGDGKVISLEEKPVQPKSRYAIPGLYFYDHRVVEYARNLQPSARGELEITDLNRVYLQKEALYVERLGRGTAWLDTGSHKSLLEAAEFVQVLENRQGLKIACLEEIAFERGLIEVATLYNQIEKMGNSSYSTYLKKILSERQSSFRM